MSGKPTVLVTGATGSQGGAVVSELLKSDTISIRVMTRNPESEKAKSLEAKGIQVVKGDMFDSSSLRTALTGCDSGFLVTDFSGPKGVEGEAESGKLFVDAAKDAGTKHVVFSSVGNAETKSGVPHFESKFKVEEHLRASGLDWTILRPVAFMDNFPTAGGLQRYMTLGVFSAALQGKSIKLIAVQDIGWFAARALEKPQEWKGKEIALAGDDVTVDQIKAAYEHVEGGKPWEAPLPQIALKAMLPTEMYTMFTWFGKKGYDADIPALRKIHPGLLTFEQWLRTKKSA